MALTLEDLFASPDHYLHSFDSDEAVFVTMDAAAYRCSIFLDDRIEVARPGSMPFPVTALTGDFGPAPRMGWIFHIAHCGSTLLSRGLGELTSDLMLREPLALRQLALSPDPARLGLALRLLGKRYPGAGPTVIKANVPVNFILPHIAGADPAAPAIMLYYGLRDYLLAILRSDNHRGWLRNVTAQLAPHLGDISHRSDAERAAVLWLAQIRSFAAAIAAMPEARALDAERFFAEPTRTLRGAAERFGIAADEGAIAQLIASPMFATYAKNPGVAFDNAARVERRASLETALADELDAAEAWLAEHARDTADLVAALERAAL